MATADMSSLHIIYTLSPTQQTRYGTNMKHEHMRPDTAIVICTVLVCKYLGSELRCATQPSTYVTQVVSFDCQSLLDFSVP